MTYHARINPILYNRLQFALADIPNGIDAEVEFVTHHLDQALTTYAQHWDQLHPAPNDPRKRYLDGTLQTINAFYLLEARMNHDNIIELRNIRIVPDPDT